MKRNTTLALLLATTMLTAPGIAFAQGDHNHETDHGQVAEDSTQETDSPVDDASSQDTDVQIDVDEDRVETTTPGTKISAKSKSSSSLPSSGGTVKTSGINSDSESTTVSPVGECVEARTPTIPEMEEFCQTFRLFTSPAEYRDSVCDGFADGDNTPGVIPTSLPGQCTPGQTPPDETPPGGTPPGGQVDLPPEVVAAIEDVIASIESVQAALEALLPQIRESEPIGDQIEHLVGELDTLHGLLNDAAGGEDPQQGDRTVAEEIDHIIPELEGIRDGIAEVEGRTSLGGSTVEEGTTGGSVSPSSTTQSASTASKDTADNPASSNTSSTSARPLSAADQLDLASEQPTAGTVAKTPDAGNAADPAAEQNHATDH